MIKNAFYIIIFFVYECKRILSNFINNLKNVFFNNRINYSNNNLINFLNTNKNNLEKLSSKKIIPNGKILITDFVSLPAYTIRSCVIGKYISLIKNYKLLGFVRQNDERAKLIMKSYDVNNFYILDYNNFFLKFMFFIRILIKYKKIKNVDNFLKIKINKINLGLIVYDHILRHTGIGTCNKLNFKFYYHLAEGYIVNKFCNNLFAKEKFSYAVIGENQFIPSAILFENALKYKCKILTPFGGSNIFGIKMYKNLSERFSPKQRISQNLFKYICKFYKKKSISAGKKFIKKRFDGILSEDIRDSRAAFKKKIFISKKNLCKQFGWDEKMPIACIFSHDLVDGNFLNKNKIFKDNLTWLRETLKQIKTITDINWIIKDHPSDHFKNSKTTAKNEYLKILGNYNHVNLFNNNWSSSSLKNIINIAVTSHGSAGLEYPCFGIPSILAGSSHYSGFGFAHETKSKEEYFNLLRTNIKNKKNKLNSEQIKKAQIYIYIISILTNIKTPILPKFNITRKNDENQFFKNLTRLVKKYKFKEDIFLEMLSKQIIKNNNHLINYKLINKNLF